MRVVMSQEGAITVLKPMGPIITGELEELDEQLLSLFNNWTKRIVINMTEVAFIDSAGLELINRYQRQFQSHGLKIKFCGLNDISQKILDLTNLNRQFEIFPDTTMAIRSFL